MTSGGSLGGRARVATGWQFLSKSINTVLRLATSVVLARLLMPADFGILAMATMVVGLAGVFRSLGLGQALVQRRELGREHAISAFWGTLVMGVALCGLVILVAPYVATYFDEPRMVRVLKVLSLSFVLSSFGVVPRSLRLVVSQRASGKQAAARNTMGRLTNGFQHGSRNDSTAAQLFVDSGRQSHHQAAPHP